MRHSDSPIGIYETRPIELHIDIPIVWPHTHQHSDPHTDLHTDPHADPHTDLHADPHTDPPIESHTILLNRPVQDIVTMLISESIGFCFT